MTTSFWAALRLLLRQMMAPFQEPTTIRTSAQKAGRASSGSQRLASTINATLQLATSFYRKLGVLFSMI
jgi:hypothetical protein